MRLPAPFISKLPFVLLLLIVCGAKSAGPHSFSGREGNYRTDRSSAKGVVMELKPDGRTVVIRHEAISNYMAAMTMPFKVKDPNELAGLQRGDEISFQLHVTESESWVEHIVKIGTVSLPPVPDPGRSASASGRTIHCWITSSPTNWARR